MTWITGINDRMSDCGQSAAPQFDDESLECSISTPSEVDQCKDLRPFWRRLLRWWQYWLYHSLLLMSDVACVCMTASLSRDVSNPSSGYMYKFSDAASPHSRKNWSVLVP